MRLISSRLTYVNKRVFPTIWYGFVAMGAIFLIPTIVAGQAPPLALLPLAIMAAVGYFLFRTLVLDLVDEVHLDSDYVYVRNQGTDVRIPIHDIANVNVTSITNPERITLTLRENTPLGNEVTFMAPTRLFPFGKHPLAKELIEIVQARRDASLYAALTEQREA